MEPQIGIRGREMPLLNDLRNILGFNGAPDRNPGKGAYQRWEPN